MARGTAAGGGFGLQCPSPTADSGPASSSGHAVAAAAPRSFQLFRADPAACADARFDESLLESAVTHGPTACIWQAARGLVVPRTYRRFPDFDTACADFAHDGWPVTVRQTGGGIVPQGPGIINLSLAYLVEGPPMRHSEPGYVLICGLLSQALDTLGVPAFPAPVEGSFCDGRYNLAVRRGEGVVKVAGTAQLWRRVKGADDAHVGLVHALVLVDAHTAGLTEIANRFETAIGSDRRYRADRVVSVAEVLPGAVDIEYSFRSALERVLKQQDGSACLHDRRM